MDDLDCLPACFGDVFVLSFRHEHWYYRYFALGCLNVELMRPRVCSRVIAYFFCCRRG